MVEGIHISLSQAAAWLGAEAIGGGGQFHGISSDSRSVAPGSLFVALRGEHHDGHDFVAAAAAAGAAAALVSQRLPLPIPQLLVADTRAALGRLGAAWRRHLGTPLAAITGSNGKTSVKEMSAAILAQSGSVLATRGNLNNDLGVPLTLLRLTREHRAGVIEMGANHPGEIAYLTELTHPNAAVVTNAGPAHLAGFGSVAGVAAAKGEIFHGVMEGGTAVINADDPYADLWRELAAGLHTVSFGLDQAADLMATFSAEAGASQVRLSGLIELDLRLPLAGRHNVYNALAAASLTLSIGADAAAVKAGLEGLVPVAGRLQPRPGRQGAQVIDDAYNANPASVQAALEVLAARPGRRLLVLGDMAELGRDAARLHGEIGAQARRLGIDGLYATGGLAAEAVAEFGPGALHFSDQAALTAALVAELAPDVTVLVKGSRSARMERVVAGIAEGVF